jgi:signal transduction histidine kinase
VASERQGTFETFVHAAGLLVNDKVELYGLGRDDVTPEAVVEGTRNKLWEIHDRMRDQNGERDPQPTVAVTVAERDAGPDLDGDCDIFSDADLDLDLGPVSLDAVEPPPGGEHAEEPEGLLEDVIEANVELAQQFGDLDQYKSLLERKNRELVQIAQNTVHDLNRPLSVIQLMLSSMGRGFFGDVSDKMADAIENGLYAVRQMERLIRDLLDSSRLDFDGVRLQFDTVDMTLLVAEIIRSLRYELDERDVSVCVEPLPVIQGDEWALNKAFMNLIGNSLQYVHPDRRGQVKVYCETADDHHVFTVEDNGIGVPAKDLDRLFRRFERGSNTGGVSGTGLGLHIVREVALGHGGSVSVDSAEGLGSAFRISLPFEPVMPPHSRVSDVAQDD